MAFWYINPSIAPGDESDAFDGGLGSGKLRDSWADVTWTAGDTYAQACGTTFTGAVTIGGSGTEGSPITLTSYGTGDRPAINANAVASTGCIYATGRSYIAIENFELYGATAFPTAGVHTINCNNVSVDNVWSHGNEYGIRFDNASSAEVSGYSLTNSLIEDSEQSGIIIVTGTSAGGTMRDVTVNDNVIRNSGSVVDNNGVQIATRIASTGAYDATRVIYDFTMLRNVVDQCSLYGINLRYVTNGYVAFNECKGAGKTLAADTHSIWLGGCRNVTVLGNHVHHNYGWLNGSSGSGIGIFVDAGDANAVGEGCQNCRVIGNYIHDQFRGASTATAASAAILVYRSVNTVIMGNVVRDCRYGIGALGATTNNSEDVLVYNNTCVDIDAAAFFAANKSDTIVFRNNIALRAGAGFFAESGANAAVNVTREYNCAYDCTDHNFATGTLAALSADTANTGDIEVDPLLATDFRLAAGSPCRGAGAYIKGAKHYGSREMSLVSPDMGAHRYFAPRATIARPTVAR